MLNDVESNPCAGITKHYFDLLVLREIPRRDLQLASVWHCIAAIIHEVEKYLVEAVAIGGDARQVLSESDCCLNVPRFKHWPYEQRQLPDGGVNVGQFERYPPTMRALEQTPDCLDHDA